MNEGTYHLGSLREMTLDNIALILVVLVGSRVLILLMRRLINRAADGAASHRRLLILRIAPIARLLVGLIGIAIIVPLLVEPSVEDILALVATASLALAFALKDYVSCVFAGIFTIIENTYQPGDWIEIDGIYGEVKAIGTRAVHIVTADDTEVIIPHARLWSTSVHNASGGKQSLLCVTNFYLRPDHDAAAIVQVLAQIAEACSYRKPESAAKVVVTEMPWGTRYKIKAYVADSRDQFAMVTDMTVRGKERLRGMGVVFAQVPYAETGKG